MKEHVTIFPKSEKNQIFLALGSNINPASNLPRAVELLAEQGPILGKSSVWQSKPVDASDQADFLNAAVLMETSLSAITFCREVIAEIEQQLDRVRDPDNKNGPRTIDIDLVLFNEEQLQVEHRMIPDPEIADRIFLAIPLAELAPDYCVPGQKKTLSQIASNFDPTAENQMVLRSDVQL